MDSTAAAKKKEIAKKKALGFIANHETKVYVDELEKQAQDSSALAAEVSRLLQDNARLERERDLALGQAALSKQSADELQHELESSAMEVRGQRANACLLWLLSTASWRGPMLILCSPLMLVEPPAHTEHCAGHRSNGRSREIDG